MTIPGNPSLKAYLFGQPRLRFEGEPLAFRVPARAFSLLGYVLLHRERPLERDAVAFAYWPDVPEVDARTKLRAHLHALVKRLPPQDQPWLLADKRTIQWNPAAPVWVDVGEFERLSQDPASAPQAAELYAGDLLVGFDEGWIEARRTELRERQIDLLVGLIEAGRGAADRARTNQYAQQLLSLDPWREDAVRALIEVRAETGDRTGALTTYRRFAQKLRDELGIDPMPETTRAYERVMSAAVARETQAGPSPATATNNLPAYITSFVGRAAEVDALQATLLQRRLVTLIGPGGVGKTRLAVEAARTVLDRFSDGVWLVELGAFAEDRLVSPAVAGALGLLDPSESGVAAALQQRNTLLVLDNCEHLPMISRLIERLLRQCPGVRVVATSREPLRVTGERIERISALPTSGAGSTAVQLLLDRVADVTPIAVANLGEADRQALVTISKRLDGLPLAIELAAARAGTMTLSALAQRLEQSFSFLTGGSRAALPRHRTLRATIDWSHDSLDSVDQGIFARAGIFAGGWDIEAAAALCSDFGLERWNLQDRLASLVDKSLILAERSGEHLRYRFLETMREYALERLHAKGERDSASRQHARYYATLAHEDVAQRYIDGAWFAMLKPELQNIRGALRWTVEFGNDPALGASLAESLAWFAHNSSLCAEALGWCDAALEALGASLTRQQEASLALARSRCLTFLQSHSPGFACERRAVELFRELDDEPALAYATSYLADALWRGGRAAEARDAARDAARIARGGGDMRTLAHTLAARARVTEDLDRKRALFADAMEAYRSINSRHGILKSLLEIGECAFEAGDAEAAYRCAQDCIASLFEGVESEQHPLTIVRCNAAAYALALGRIDEARFFASGALNLAHRIGDHRRTAWALQHLAGVALALGNDRRAAHLLGASEGALSLAMMPERSFTERVGYEKIVARLSEALSESELVEAIAHGRRWSAEQAVAEAMQAE